MVTHDGNGGKHSRVKFERGDLLKVGGFVVTLVTVVVGAAVGLALFVFETRYDATTAHAHLEAATTVVTIEQSHTAEAVQSVKRDVSAIRQVVRTMDTNQRVLMDRMRVPERARKPLPAGIDFDNLADSP